MKKILLLSMMALISGASFGQYKNSNVTAPQQQGKMSIGKDIDKTRFKNSHTKTRGGTQYIDYAAFLEAKTGNTPSTFVFFMFPDSNMRFDAPDNAFGIQYKSVGAVLHPGAKIFQDLAVAGDLIFWDAPHAYTIDSVFIAASYNKVSAATDTLSMSLLSSEGTNLPIFYFAGGDFTTNFAVDTGRFALMSYDDSKYNKGPVQIAKGGPAPYVVNRVLSNSDSVGPNGGTGFGLKYLGFSGNNYQVTPGEVPAVSFTFKPGFSWLPGDQVSTKNHFLFRSSEPNGDNTFMPYYKGDFNMHSVVYKDSTNWGGDYIPTIAWSQGYAPEVHDIIWKVTCADCNLVGINDLAENIHYTASPNPTSSVINFDMNFENSAKNVTITLTNLVGQPVRTMNLGSMSAQVDRRETMNISDLTPGFYFYTIKADNQKLTDKILIK